MAAGLPRSAVTTVEQLADGTVTLAGVAVIRRAAGLAVTGDLRLDDTCSLAARLGCAPTSEAALVLAAYERWGDRCPEELAGDFAFALWDGRHRRFFCARDSLGVKPFYFHLSAGSFAFASDPEAVLRAPDVHRRLNRRAPVEYLYGLYDDPATTPYEAVSRLPAGHALVVGTDRHQPRRHWRPEAVPEWRGADDATYEEAFREAMTAAVATRLPARDAGVYLSGGLDSSSVTCVAQGIFAGGRLATFSAVFDDEPRSDERQYAAAAASHVGAESVLCHTERTSPLADWSGAPWTWPAPSCDPQVAVSRVVTEEAAARGVSVLLSGFGGDSVVSHGPAYLSELVGSARPGRFVAEVRAIVRRHERPAWPLVRRYGVTPFVPRAIRRHRTRRRAATGTGVPVRADVAVQMGMPDRLADFAARRGARTAREAHLHGLIDGHTALALEGSYRVDAVVGIERRYPFLDRRLAELCLSLPGDQKLRNGWTRSILRRALAGVLPEEVRTRVGKTDLTPGFRRSLLGSDRAMLEQLVARPTAVADWVDPAALGALWDRCRADGQASDCYALWRVAVLASWLRHHGFAD